MTDEAKDKPDSAGEPADARAMAAQQMEESVRGRQILAPGEVGLKVLFLVDTGEGDNLVAAAIGRLGNIAMTQDTINYCASATKHIIEMLEKYGPSRTRLVIPGRDVRTA